MRAISDKINKTWQNGNDNYNGCQALTPVSINLTVVNKSWADH